MAIFYADEQFPFPVVELLRPLTTDKKTNDQIDKPGIN